jgi:ABC-2 type transport system permease protein
MSAQAWAKYLYVFKVQIQNQLTYRGDLVGRSLTIVLFMWIFFHLWQTTYRAAGAAEGAIAGLTLSDTLWYLMLAEAIILSRNNVWRPISEAVKDGSIAYMLNKPYNFVVYHASASMADMTGQFLFNVLAGGAVVWVLVGPPPDPAGLPLLAIPVLLAFLIDFCISAMIGLAAFVTEEVAAFNWIYQKFILLLGGVLIPLDFFPGWLKSISITLPFAYTIYRPARFFIDTSLDGLFSLLSGQLLWLGTFGLVLAVIYRGCITRLNINGG